jgi:hypothetical protein
LRVAVIAALTAGGLAFAGNALAGYTPHLTVTHTPLTLGGNGTTDITVSFGGADDATAKATVYVPSGYTGTLGGATPGATVGTVTASIVSPLISPTTPLPLTGVITTDAPSKYSMQGGTFVGTPYAAGTGIPNPSGTMQAQAFVQLPAQLSLKGKVKRRRATLSGVLK